MAYRPDPSLLKALRARIEAIERTAAAGPGAAEGAHGEAYHRVVSLGDAEIDHALPWSGLPRGALHEIVPAGWRDGAAAAGFCAALLVRLLSESGEDQSVLWCARRDGLYDGGVLDGPGLAALGLDPGRLIMVCGPRDRDVLWAMEEGLACRRLGAVVGEVREAGLTATRRLSLAVRGAGAAAFLLRAPAASRTGGTSISASAALTRWRIAARPATRADFGGNSVMPRWRVELVRCRNGRPRDWLVEWNHETHRLTVASAVAGRAPLSGAARAKTPGRGVAV